MLVCFFLSAQGFLTALWELHCRVLGQAPLTSLGPWFSVPRNCFSLAVHFLGKEPSDLLPGQGGDKPAPCPQAGAEKGRRVFLSPTVDFYFCDPAFPCPWHHRGQKVTEWGVDVGVSLLLRFSPDSPVIGHFHVQRSLIPKTFLGSMPKLSWPTLSVKLVPLLIHPFSRFQNYWHLSTIITSSPRLLVAHFFPNTFIWKLPNRQRSFKNWMVNTWIPTTNSTTDMWPLCVHTSIHLGIQPLIRLILKHAFLIADTTTLLLNT